MSDERAIGQELRRLRNAMVALILMAVAALGVLVAMLLQVSTPKGLDVQATRSGGMRWIRSIYGYGPSAAEQLQSPTDVAFGVDGTLWVTDPGRGRVLCFSQSGALRRAVGGVPATGHPSVLVRPEGIGAGDDGSLYVADYGRGVVLRFDASGRVNQEWRVPSPLDVAVHGGRVAVSTLYGVAVIERDGTVKTWGRRGRGPYDFDVAHGVTFGADGTLYVADTQNGRVKAYAADGTLRWIAAGVGSRGSTASVEASVAVGTFELASGLAVDGAGRVVFCDPFGFSLVVLDGRTGREIAKHGEGGVADGLLQYPSGVAYDPGSDRFAVADTRNGRVQLFEIPGSRGAALPLRRIRAPWWAAFAAAAAALIAGALARRRARRRGARAEGAPATC